MSAYKMPGTWARGSHFVVKGVAKRSVLKLYGLERRAIAQELIAVDHRSSRLFSARPAKNAADEAGIFVTEFQQAFLQQQLFSSSFAVNHNTSDLTANCSSSPQIMTYAALKVSYIGSNNTTKETSHQHLATHVPLGKRLPGFKVVNQSDARSWHSFR